jgi:hypothetical protein
VDERLIWGKRERECGLVVEWLWGWGTRGRSLECGEWDAQCTCALENVIVILSNTQQSRFLFFRGFRLYRLCSSLSVQSVKKVNVAEGFLPYRHTYGVSVIMHGLYLSIYSDADDVFCGSLPAAREDSGMNRKLDVEAISHDVSYCGSYGAEGSRTRIRAPGM